MVKVIAEIGMNHDGSLGQAKAFAKAAADCGVNAIKFQTHIAEAETLLNAPRPKYFQNESRFDFFKRTAFNVDQHIELKKYIEQDLGAEFMSSPFSIEAVELLVSIGVKTLKIPSGEVNNLPYLEHISQTGLDILLSTGMSTIEEIEQAYTVLSSKDCNVTILQCTSEYPCPADKVGLNNLKRFKDRFKCNVGFSDHTLGVSAAILSVQLGASVIEKHFSISKILYGPDAKFSADPDDMKLLVQSIRDAEVMLTSVVDKNKEAQDLLDMKITFEKSIVSKQKMKRGEPLTFEKMSFKKPGDGIKANQYKSYINKVVKMDIDENHKFSTKDFE